MKTERTLDKSGEPSAEELSKGLVISVGEARKLLGTDAKEHSDNQIIEQIHRLTELAYAILKSTLSSYKK
ncbi:MAG: hypothetical protein WAW80_03760 [Candidatus Saccharimonadales bacterium]